MWNHFPLVLYVYRSPLKLLLPEYIELEHIEVKDKTQYFNVKPQACGIGFFMKGFYKSLGGLKEIGEFGGLLGSIRPQSHPTSTKFWLWQKPTQDHYVGDGSLTMELNKYPAEYKSYSESFRK